LDVIAMDPNTLTITDAAKLIERRELSPVELTRACLDRISQVEDRVHAFVVVLQDEAIAAAKEAENDISGGRYRGPLHGIPVGIKDLYDMAGVPTTASSAVRADYVPTEDSATVASLRQAGAIIVGKTHTHEFAYGAITPTTRNPWDIERVPGGSSGGSAAAVAAGECLMAMGSDTGGSIRIPASVCGTVGLKPTYGRSSKYGVTPLSWSLDHVGPLSRTVRDAAIVLNAIAGRDPRDPSTVDVGVPDYTESLEAGISGKVVGVPTNYFFDQVDTEVETAVRQAIAALESQGAKIREVKLPYVEQYVAVEFAIILPEASSYHQGLLRERGHLYTEDVRLFLETGELLLATDYIAALRVRQLIQEGWRQAFDGIDVLAAPSLPTVAARAGDQVITFEDGSEEPVTNAYVRFSCPANITGMPAMSVPCGVNSAGLPIGLQLIGRPFDEATVLRVGRAHEVTSDWNARQPVL
jgi:aspartyl-tRNA(Asn)/glutamyl-tRNA(Gln) amidotransferase subunit A